MKIATKSLQDLIPASYNPRSISREALKGLAASIKQFGLVEPIIWNEQTDRVVGGHQRLKILEQEGVPETEVVVVDLDASQEKALNIALNNPHIQGEFTSDLQNLLDDLQNSELMLDLRLDALVVPEIDFQVPVPIEPVEPSVPKCLIEIRCPREMVEQWAATLEEWRAGDGVTINIS